MAIHILGGVAKGFTLNVPKGQTIRPTSVLLRRRLFDYYQDWSETVFIDGCCGSGAMGLEAWSRGAIRVALVELSKNVFKIMQKNCEKIQYTYPDEFKERPLFLTNGDILDWCRHQHRSTWNDPHSKIIFYLDPPYAKLLLYQKVIQQLKKYWKCELWLEGDEQVGLALAKESGLDLDIYKVFTQGPKYVALIHIGQQ